MFVPSRQNSRQKFHSPLLFRGRFQMLRIALIVYLMLATGIGQVICCCTLANDEASPPASKPKVSGVMTDKIPEKHRSCRHHGGQHPRHTHDPHEDDRWVAEDAESPACPDPCNLPCECDDLFFLKVLAEKGRGSDSECSLPSLMRVAAFVHEFCAMTEVGMVDYRRRNGCAGFPTLSAPEILRAFQTFRC